MSHSKSYLGLKGTLNIIMHALEVGSLRSQSMSGIKPIPSSRYLALTNDDLIFGNTIKTFCYLTYEIIKLFILIPGNEKFVSDFQSKKSYFCKFCQAFSCQIDVCLFKFCCNDAKFLSCKTKIVVVHLGMEFLFLKTATLSTLLWHSKINLSMISFCVSLC